MLRFNLGEEGKRGQGDATSPALSLAHEIKYNLLGQELNNEMTRKILLSLKISSDLKNLFFKGEGSLSYQKALFSTALPHYSALPVKGGKAYLFSLTPES